MTKNEIFTKFKLHDKFCHKTFYLCIYLPLSFSAVHFAVSFNLDFHLSSLFEPFAIQQMNTFPENWLNWVHNAPILYEKDKSFHKHYTKRTIEVNKLHLAPGEIERNKDVVRWWKQMSLL